MTSSFLKSTNDVPVHSVTLLIHFSCLHLLLLPKVVPCMMAEEKSIGKYFRVQLRANNYYIISTMIGCGCRVTEATEYRNGSLHVSGLKVREVFLHM